MKIGIITPTASEFAPRACLASVRAAAEAAGAPYLHVIVGDGVGKELYPDGAAVGTDFIPLLERAADAGATPRAVGSAYAIGQGCDALFFLDDDNTFAPTHIANAIQLAEQGAQVVTSLRWMVSAVTGERMYVDEEDSDGINFADTNTVALFGQAAQFGTTWAWFRQPSGTDRVFWDRIRHSFFGNIACTGQPTVDYVTRWAATYNVLARDVIGNYPQWQAPNPAKFVAADERGVRHALVAEPVWNSTKRCWVPKDWIAKEEP